MKRRRSSGQKSGETVCAHVSRHCLATFLVARLFGETLVGLLGETVCAHVTRLWPLRTIWGHRERASSKGQGRPSQQTQLCRVVKKTPVNKKCSLQQQLDAKEAKSEKSSATQFATCASVPVWRLLL